jgi:hypothetical protein
MIRPQPRTALGIAAAVLLLCLLAIPAFPVSSQSEASQSALPRLQLSDNGHYLVTAEGQPFFWLADTGWEIFARLTREEIEEYLEHRRLNGFKVIQVSILSEYGFLAPNVEGELPVVDNDPLQPNEAYFAYVDWAIELAAEKGLYMAIVPVWGDKVNLKGGLGPEIFTVESARSFGAYVGARYRDYSNIIWFIGGDRNPENETHLAIWRAMAAGVEEGAGEDALITFHPRGQKSSAQWFHDDEVFDFNVMQSGHSYRDIPVWEWITTSYELLPPKPIIDAEMNFEGFAVNKKRENGFFTDYDVRKQAYRSVFAGAAGVGYGHHSIWQFYTPERRSIGFADVPWQEAVNAPGALQMRYLAALMLSRPYLERIPDQALIVTEKTEQEPINATHARATRASDGRYAFIYIPTNQPLTIDLSLLSGTSVRAWWYDPRTGESILVGEYVKADAPQFLPPVTYQDWVLVLDDAVRGFPAPGSTQ